MHVENLWFTTDNGTVINKAKKYRQRRLTALAILTALVVGIAGIIVFVNRKPEVEKVIPEPRTPPLSYEGFNAGEIISNKNFTNVDSMSAEQIQAFLDDWGYGCREGSTASGKMADKTGITNSALKDLGNGQEAVPCLQHYHGDMQSYPADSYCRQEVAGGSNLSAADIIYRVGQACAVNPQVILATLQKEQGLITASSGKLTPRRYQIAMGYACPDSTNCDSQFFGFSTQVYHAARQFQRYHRDSAKYEYRAQGTYQMRNGPGEECGTTQVKIQNWATASLYNYTPYPPTKDALKGVFDDCNQPGNLNFYAYYKAWFGDPKGNESKLASREEFFPPQTKTATK